MGVPLTRFSMLSKLMQRNTPRNNDESIEQDAAKYYFKQFNLYAIILCRPDDTRFINYISDNFPRLDKRTGKNLLFFSLAEPGVTTEAYKMSVSPEEAMMDTEKYPVDEEIYLYVLTQALKVSTFDFPLILVTDSLKKRKWYVMGTSVDHVYGDLMMLTDIANDPDFRFGNMIEEELDRIIQSAGRYWYAVESSLPLCECLAGIEAASATHSPDREKSKKALDTSLQLETSLKQSESRDAHELYFLFRCLRKSPRGGIWRKDYRMESLSICPRNLEGNTINYLYVYRKILSCYADHRLIEYSALSSLTHKIFETELNASILQLMRAFLEIPMPEYYNKWYENENENKYSVKTGPKFFVNLNSSDLGNPRIYRSPGLGNAYYAFKTLNKSNEWKTICASFGLDHEKVRDFESCWYKIFQIRNQEAHCTPMSFEDYQGLTKSVNKVFELYFDKMAAIKSHLTH